MSAVQHVLTTLSQNMDHSGGSSDGQSCKISMLWNWYTVDACFLARSWHVKSSGGMAASCIGVMLLTVSLELLRRTGKEYDAFLTRSFHAEATRTVTKKAVATRDGDSASPLSITFRASPLQQLARAVIHAITFGVAYIVMLLAMYFNGYIIISIFIGAGIGKFLCDWLVVRVNLGALPGGQDTNEHAIDEPTICCG